MDAETEGQVYRIAQEALTNIRKHAAARRVRVSMAVADGRVILRIEDDGRGLAVLESPAGVPHYGLRSMRERAATIGAQLDVARGPRGGTLVTLVVPLAGHEHLDDGQRVPAGTGLTSTGPPRPAGVGSDREG